MNSVKLASAVDAIYKQSPELSTKQEKIDQTEIILKQGLDLVQRQAAAQAYTQGTDHGQKKSDKMEQAVEELLSYTITRARVLAGTGREHELRDIVKLLHEILGHKPPAQQGAVGGGSYPPLKVVGGRDA